MTDDLRPSGATTRAVHLERDYRATPEQLWDAWTSPQRLARWLGTVAGPLLGATAPVRMILGDGDDQWADVRIRSADRPRSLELSWDFPGESGSVISVRFVPLSDTHTRLVIDHSGLADAATGYGAGWQAYLEGGLAGLFDSSVDVDWDRRFLSCLGVWRERAAALA